MRWFPDFLDTLIPLSLGAAQFVVAGIIRESNQVNWYYWLVSLALLFLIAGFAYLNAAFKTTSLLFTEHYGKELSENYSQYIKRGNVVAGISGFAHCVFTLLIAYQKIDYSMLFIIEFSLLLHFVAYEFYYTKKIKPHYILMLHARKAGLINNIPE